MRKISLYIPKYRLDLQIVKRRGSSIEEPIIPRLSHLRKFKSGNKVSRIFRHIFEHKRVKSLFGRNLALAILAASFIPGQPAIFDGIELPEPLEQVEITTPTTTDTPLTTQRGVRYPLETVKQTQGYTFYHGGVDFDGITGDAVYPIMVGIVVHVQYSQYAYGNAVALDHGSGIQSLYAHLSKINVNLGQTVDLNTPLGEVGTTGRAYGDHLHLEVRENGRNINPYTILPRE